MAVLRNGCEEATVLEVRSSIEKKHARASSSSSFACGALLLEANLARHEI